MKSLFDKRLKELLEDKKITKIELAKAIQVSDTCVSFWTSGKRQPTADNIYAIAKFFGVSSDYLLGLSDY